MELLKKNPAGSIPVIVKRLKQKDIEWRKARQELNKTWKELVDKNYEKSFDHQIQSFKLADKRFYSAKNLVNDIKGGNSEMEQYLLGMAPGIFTEVPAELTDKLSDMKPHLALEYDAADQGALQDIYRLICHAMEVTNVSTNDKERIASLWRDLLRVFFNMPVHFLYSGQSSAPPPSTSSSSVSHAVGTDVTTGDAAGAASTMESDGSSIPVPATLASQSGWDIDALPVHAGEAYQIGTKVLTLFGSGEVIGFRTSDNTYEIQLPYGIGYLRPSVVLGAEELSVNALEAIGVHVDGEGNEFVHGVRRTPASTNHLVTDPSKIFLGNQMCYTFFRLHHTLYWRFVLARRLAHSKLNLSSTNEYDVSAYDDIDVSEISNLKGNEYPIYNSFMSQLFALIDGSIDSNRYEDMCRQLLSNKGYFVYTLDKVVQQLLKCLQSMSSDENVTKLVGIFMYYRSHTEGVDSAAYQKHVASSLSHLDEDVYRFQLVTPVLHDSTQPIMVGCQLLGSLGSKEFSQSINGSGNSNSSLLADVEETNVDGQTEVEMNK